MLPYDKKDVKFVWIITDTNGKRLGVAVFKKDGTTDIRDIKDNLVRTYDTLNVNVSECINLLEAKFKEYYIV